jgi:integrase
MRKTDLLSTFRVKQLTEPGRYYDGSGLSLQIAPGGAKTWLFKYQRDGRERMMGLGPWPLVSLAEARERVRKAKLLLHDGTDPIDDRKARRTAARVEKAKTLSFEDAAEQYVSAHEAGWRNPKHRAQWRSTLAAYAYPTIGSSAVSQVDTERVLELLKPIWLKKPETATRLRGRIEKILDWAKVRGYRSGENPARWRGNLASLLPAKGRVRGTEHHPALPFEKVADFMKQLRALPGVSPFAFEFTILTATRTSEVTGARWEEFDLGARTWTVPKERMKAKRDHRVPLSERAFEIVSAMKDQARDDAEFVFPGARKGKPLSNMAFIATLRRMDRSDITPHGFRSTFRDWASETTGHDPNIVEMALAHTIRNKVEAAYRRGDLFAKRRQLMDDWARFCAGEKAHVVSLRAVGE